MPLALAGILIAAILGFVVARNVGHGSSARSTSTPSPSYASGLDSVIGRLNRIRSGATRQLAGARDASAQAAAASKLATAHSQAAAAVLRLKPPTGSDANSVVAAALRQVGSAYEGVAAALHRGDAAGLRTANASLTKANNALDSAFAQLRRLGYQVE